jgi:hypothetical protein
MTWSGQFNLDFMTFLGLSGIWVAWRHQFTGGAIALGVVAFFGGMMFLAPYPCRNARQAAPAQFVFYTLIDCTPHGTDGHE